MRVGVFVAPSAVEPAEFAVGYAHVRVVEVAVHIVESGLAVFFTADAVREPAESVQVFGLKESETVLVTQPLARHHLERDGIEFWIGIESYNFV